MTPQRRTAFISVLAAIVLVAVKLVTGLATHSLGLVSEAIHSGTDLVAALLTFFAVGVAARPADASHTYGHGKAEHLAALAEAGILVLASLFVAARAIMRVTGSSHGHVHAAWYALAVFVAVLVLIAAARLMRTNVDVLMDRVPAEAEAAARAAIADIRPAVELRRLRMREAGG